MDVSLFDFDLPERLIALRPVSPRDSARLCIFLLGATLRIIACPIYRRFCAQGMFWSLMRRRFFGLL